MHLRDFITNSDNRGSTTTFIQFVGFFILAAALIYAIYLNRANVTELYSIFAFYCGGLVATKGAVGAFNVRSKRKYAQTEARVREENSENGNYRY